jgi:hypothetical protein
MEVWARGSLGFGNGFMLLIFCPEALLNSSSISTVSGSPPVFMIAYFSIFYYNSSACSSPTNAAVESSVLSLSSSFCACFSSSTAF